MLLFLCALPFQPFLPSLIVDHDVWEREKMRRSKVPARRELQPRGGWLASRDGLLGQALAGLIIHMNESTLCSRAVWMLYEPNGCKKP
ncbi:hypothetical protein CDAR_535261 [Caerostris darwini]|uniref:Secreted protein n=1 Tax=Caerostris darwini TaxID=1538125 RepID=A0AAV4QLM4_9ARAC|nr:hypothetical protein CDAR_535261 [Caerostris darwini]